MLFYPLISNAQDPGPRFERDTLYTTCGYKFFRGQTIEFAKGTLRDGKFKYTRVKNGFLSKTLTNRQVIIKNLKRFDFSALGNGYIDFDGYIILPDNTRAYIVLHMAFDRAIENSPDLPSELKVPDEFRNTRKRDIEQELITMENMYGDRVINKAEYEALKKKILKQ